jgi:dienelactone hydrolase
MRLGPLSAMWRGLCAVTLLSALLSPAGAQEATAQIALSREHRGASIEVPAQLMLPPGAGKVPAMIVLHGSGGVSAAREGRYAKEIAKLGVATLVIDAFTPRGVKSTVADQRSVTAREMMGDVFAAAKALAQNPRIDALRIGIVGFSKGGSVALMTALQKNAEKALPPGMRLALHVAFYPSCRTQEYQPKTTGAPIYMLIGRADTYAGTKPCLDYAEKLKAAAADVTLILFPNAQHGFDGNRTYSNPKIRNVSRCVYEQQVDGSWKERTSGETTRDASGKRHPDALKRALAKCETRGIAGAPNAAARTKSMADLKAAIRRHLIDGSGSGAPAPRRSP